MVGAPGPAAGPVPASALRNPERDQRSGCQRTGFHDDAPQCVNTTGWYRVLAQWYSPEAVFIDADLYAHLAPN